VTSPTTNERAIRSNVGLTTRQLESTAHAEATHGNKSPKGGAGPAGEPACLYCFDRCSCGTRLKHFRYEPCQFCFRNPNHCLECKWRKTDSKASGETRRPSKSNYLRDCRHCPHPATGGSVRPFGILKVDQIEEVHGKDKMKYGSVFNCM
jgi:hypothetical protein